MKKPILRTELPGPNARALVGLDKKYVSPSYTRVYPLVVEKAKGLWVEDVDENVLLDFTSGIAVCATGHCHPEVVRAIKKQAETLLHMSGTDFYYRPLFITGHKFFWQKNWQPLPRAEKERKSTSEIPVRRPLRQRSSWPAGTPSGS